MIYWKPTHLFSINTQLSHKQREYIVHGPELLLFLSVMSTENVTVRVLQTHSVVYFRDTADKWQTFSTLFHCEECIHLDQCLWHTAGIHIQPNLCFLKIWSADFCLVVRISSQPCLGYSLFQMLQQNSLLEGRRQTQYFSCTRLSPPLVSEIDFKIISLESFHALHGSALGLQRSNLHTAGLMRSMA